MDVDYRSVKMKYEIKNRSKLIGCMVLLVTAIFLIQPVFGFASSSYQASTTVTNNTIDVDYFTVGFYSSADPETATNDILVHGLHYETTGTGDNRECIFSGSSDDVRISKAPLFLKVTDPYNTNDNYIVTAQWTLTVVGEGSTLKTGVTPSMTVNIGTGSFVAGYNGSTSGNLQTSGLETAQSISFDVNNVITKGNIPASLSISIIITVKSGNNGVYDTGVVSVRAGSNVDAVASYVRDTLVITPNTEPYNVTIVDDGVKIQRSGGLGNKTHIAFNIPPGTEFMIEVRMPSLDVDLATKIYVDDVLVHDAMIATPADWNYSDINEGDSHFIWKGCTESKQVSSGTNPRFTTNALYTSMSYAQVKNTYLNEDTKWFSGTTVKVQFDDNDYINANAQYIIHLKEE